VVVVVRSSRRRFESEEIVQVGVAFEEVAVVSCMRGGARVEGAVHGVWSAGDMVWVAVSCLFRGGRVDRWSELVAEETHVGRHNLKDLVDLRGS
jgi:hypothetical protein